MFIQSRATHFGLLALPHILVTHSGMNFSTRNNQIYIKPERFLSHKKKKKKKTLRVYSIQNSRVTPTEMTGLSHHFQTQKYLCRAIFRGKMIQQEKGRI